MGGWDNKTTPNDLEEIKNFLQNLSYQNLLNINVVIHSRKKNIYQEANYRPKNQTLFIYPKILDEIKKYRIEIIKNKTSESNITLNNQLTPLKTQINTLKHLYPIFQINYQNENKEQIKKLIGEITKNKLETLRLFKLDDNKVDKYNNHLTTNYKKGLNIIYYRLEDLKHIKLFIAKDKRGYRVKKLHQKYKYVSQQTNDSFMTLC